MKVLNQEITEREREREREGGGGRGGGITYLIITRREGVCGLFTSIMWSCLCITIIVFHRRN